MTEERSAPASSPGGEDRAARPTRGGYLDRLAARTVAVGSVLCLGLDPDPARLPPAFRPDWRGIEAFANLLLEAAVPYAAAVKANLAFFEAFGSAGLAALERIRARLPGDCPFVADAKRGDIGSTAARQATALFDALGADAVTLNPYLGRDAVAPFLDRADRFVYVLCRTSNPSAAELQALEVDGEPLFLRVAREVRMWGGGDRLGLVVGATAPAELRAVRALVPGRAFLVPGLGAQGGELEAVLEAGPAREPPAGGRPGGGLLVNVSRGIADAAREAAEDRARGRRRRVDLGRRLAEAAAAWAARLAVLS